MSYQNIYSIGVLHTKFAIIDIETTGGKIGWDRITEIGVAIHDGSSVIDRFESLINPGRSIPYNITRITGITNDMVADAPSFFEVAKRIVELTEGAVFVAHNARFDYSFIKYEFERLGYTFTRKQFCTVKMSRKAFPQLRRHSLGHLITHFGIEVSARHRAMADVEATVIVFEKILEALEKEELNLALNDGIAASRLPDGISIEDIHELPEKAGIYYFYNIKNEIIYVGKSKHIRKRVKQHFSKNTVKAMKLSTLVNSMGYEITGSELIALILESQEIKKWQPQINKAQRGKSTPYSVIRYLNEAGYICLTLAKKNKQEQKKLDLVANFEKQKTATSFLQRITYRHHLCRKLTGLESATNACFQHHINQCGGACAGVESVADYNERVLEALEEEVIKFDENLIIFEAGRTHDEVSIVVIEDNVVLGYGYLFEEESISSIDEYKDHVSFLQETPTIRRIVYGYLQTKNPKVLRF